MSQHHKPSPRSKAELAEEVRSSLQSPGSQSTRASRRLNRGVFLAPAFDETTFRGHSHSERPSYGHSQTSDTMRQQMIEAIINDDRLTKEQKEQQLEDIFGDHTGCTMMSQSTEGNRGTECNMGRDYDDVLAQDEEAVELEAHVTRVQSDTTAVAAARVLMEEEEAEEEEEIRDSRFWLGSVCCMCVLMAFASAAPWVIYYLSRKEKS